MSGTDSSSAWIRIAADIWMSAAIRIQTTPYNRLFLNNSWATYLDIGYTVTCSWRETDINPLVCFRWKTHLSIRSSAEKVAKWEPLSGKTDSILHRNLFVSHTSTYSTHDDGLKPRRWLTRSPAAVAEIADRTAYDDMISRRTEPIIFRRLIMSSRVTVCFYITGPDIMVAC